MKVFFIKIIRLYQKYLSPIKGPTCVFYPTCSAYSIKAFEKYGVFKGFWLTAKRILRCHPWQKNHFDPI